MTNDKGVRLRRDIGFFGAAFLVLNAMIGAGIFALPGKVAVNAGMLSPWLFLVVGIVFLAVVLTFAELASYFRESGGPVLYATFAFGPMAGFGTGWILFLSRMTAFAANANVMATYLGSLFPWLGAGIGRAAVISVLTLGLTYTNILGVKDGVRTMGFFTVLKVLPLLLLVLLGLQHVTAGTLIPAASAVIGDLGGTTLLLIYAYVGFETMAVTAGETSEPRRVLPRALLRTVIGTGILYFLIVLVFVSVIPADTYADATLVDVVRSLAGSVGAIAITLAAVFSIGGNLAGTMIAAPRLIFALAENRLLPAWFGNIHPRYATPDHSILVMGGLALVMALTGSFVELAVASSLSRMLSYILCIGALPVIRNRASDEMKTRAYRIRGGYLVPLVGLAICLWLTAQATAENWRTVGILLAIGFVLYAVERFFQRR
jgi:amino acid transporter